MSDTEALLKERQSTHGEYREHARCTQAIMRAVMTERNWERLSDIQRESLHMFAHKMGRIAVGNPDEPDHWRDIAGYAVLVEQRLPKSDPFTYTLEPPAIIKNFHFSDNTVGVKPGDEVQVRHVPTYPYVVGPVPVDEDPMTVHQNGANGMIPGDRVQFNIDGRVGTALEFLQDGDATVHFEDGTTQSVKWNHLRKVEQYDAKHELNGDEVEVDLAPWCVKSTYGIGEIPPELFGKFWKRRAPNLMVLEPHVISEKLPRVLQKCYIMMLGNGGWLLDVKECPPEAREYFPNLYREKNQMEWEQLPHWQRDLYSRNDEANKFELRRPEWHVESE